MRDSFDRIARFIGKTPMLRLWGIEKYFGLHANLYAKLERFNPSGSIKDRTALFMVEDAFRKSLIREGGTLIEPTSGNTGISLAMLSAVYGYRAVIVMPENMSEERRSLIKGYGGEIVLTYADMGMRGAIEVARELKAEISDAYLPMQFENKQNLIAHYETTGREIYEDMKGRVDVLVSGVGTGGTVGGVGQFLKERIPNVRIVAVEPAESAVLSGRSPSTHGIQGIGAGFVPPILNTSILDSVITVSFEEAKDMCKKIAIQEGIFAGISSGAALSAAIRFARKKENNEKNVVVIFPDGGEKYISSGLGI